MNPAYLPLIAAIVWLILALLIPLFAPHRRGLTTRIMVALGVPVLGWLTLRGGPTAGLLALTLGVAVLFWRPFARRSDAHPAE